MSANARRPNNAARAGGVAEAPPQRVFVPIPRLALSVEEACEALGCSWDYWNAHIAAELRLVRRGRRKLVPVRELERWLEESAERVLDSP